MHSKTMGTHNFPGSLLLYSKVRRDLLFVCDLTDKTNPIKNTVQFVLLVTGGAHLQLLQLPQFNHQDLNLVILLPQHGLQPLQLLWVSLAALQLQQGGDLDLQEQGDGLTWNGRALLESNTDLRETLSHFSTEKPKAEA